VINIDGPNALNVPEVFMVIEGVIQNPQIPRLMP